MRKALTLLIYVLSGLLGLVAFTYPLLLPEIQRIAPLALAQSGELPATNTPLLTAALMILCLGVLLVEVNGQAVNAKVVATLGILVAVASILRFLEAAIPGPGGFSPIFVPIILAGYVFGARFGFLMGTMTLLASALLTGGVGPWLPFQMFAAGWLGMSAGWLPRPSKKGLELAMLASFAFLWGLLFGAILNLYFWPFVAGDVASSWEPGASLGDALVRYGTFYLATSFLWDLLRGAGNVVLILALGLPIARALERFRDRFQFEVA